MDIIQLLSGYQNRMLDKFATEAQNDINKVMSEDTVRAGFEQIREGIVAQLKVLHKNIPTEEGSPFTEEELEEAIKDKKIPMGYKTTLKTQNLIEKIHETKQQRKERLSDILNEVHLLTSYIEDPKEVTTILITYGIIKDGKLNMSLV